MSTNEELESLVARLSAAPFDLHLRLEYARALQSATEHDQALRQFELVLSQPGANAEAAVGAARSLLALGRSDEAHSRYSRARELPGFDPDPAVDAALAATRRASVQRLTIAGGVSDRNEASGEVVPIGVARGSRTTFADVAGMHDLKRTVRLQIIEPFLRPALFAKFRKRAGGGVLLYGPPGCGKTMLARAVAGECRAEFVSVGISDVLSMWIGQSEENLAALFEKARKAAPSVLFFDELDALAFARSKAHSEHTRQIVNEFLTQLDGFSADNTGVLVLAATNMPWDVDPAMKRPGRFARQVFIAPPDEEARATIVELKLVGLPVEHIDAHAVARATPHFSGADIEGVVEIAKEYVLEDHIAHGIERPIRQDDLARAVKEARPSTLDWLRTARNLVKYAGADDAYREVEEYLKRNRIT
jgi:SpoVK/Ycf46/Vps4 family AAA+-type ATPase